MSDASNFEPNTLGDSNSPPVAVSAVESPIGESSVEGIEFFKPLLGGLAWTASARWTAQVVNWLSTLVVIRLLSPGDFGIVGMAAVYLGLVNLLSEFGVGQTVVYVRDLSSEQLAQMNTVAVIFGFAGFGVSCAMAPVLAWFFKTPELVWVVVVMGAGFAISAFQVVPSGSLQRDKSFKLLALMDGSQALVRSLVTVALAFLGLRYWSLVVGGLLGSCVSVLLALRWRREAFARPRVRSIRRALVFSRDIIVSRFSWYAYSNADFVVAGRVLGKGPLGAYSVAWNLMSASIEKLTDLISRVTPAFFSEVQTDPATLRRYLRNLTQGISLFTFPATLGLALVAREFVPVVLGAKWLPAVVPLQLLAIYGFIRSVTTVLGPVLTAVDVRWASRNSLWFVVVFPTVFYIGSHWGTVGIAAGWVCAYPAMYLPFYRRTFRCIGMTAGEYAQAIWPALSGSLAMAAVILILRLTYPPGLGRVLQLGAEVVAGAATYTLVLVTLHGKRSRVVLQSLKAVVRKERPC